MGDAEHWQSTGYLETGRDSHLNPEKHGFYYRNGGIEIHDNSRAKFLAEANFRGRDSYEQARLSSWTTEGKRVGRPQGDRSDHNPSTLEREEVGKFLRAPGRSHGGAPVCHSILTWAPGK
ncbi:hypothetical protein CYMTET_37471 [Cymbomonas tetramitiformis]|uniref:Uncharacterized protein n=1 Tax=Cymbomonas tetramitiformis TaxID=36881 RepID=A0AAE0CDZ4_9CHLO|nr:hypothetical protein CYMTET_37471 [Cymbomonas tetramitiformis]